MLERHNARTVEVHYRLDPGQQKVHIVDATCLEPGECVIVVVMRGEQSSVAVQRDCKPSLESVIGHVKAEADAKLLDSTRPYPTRHHRTRPDVTWLDETGSDIT